MLKYGCFSLSVIPLLLAAGSAFAYSPAKDDQIPVPIAAAEVEILFTDLTANDDRTNGTVSPLRDPLRGDLELLQNGIGFRYVPHDVFWSVQIDSFIYRYTDGGGDHEAMVTLYVARFTDDQVFEQDFEDPAIFTDPNDDFEVTSLGASSLTLQSGAQIEGLNGGLFETIGGSPTYVTKLNTDDINPGNGGNYSGGITCVPQQGGGGGGLVKDLMLVAIGGDPQNPQAPPSLRLVTVQANTVSLEGWDGYEWIASKPLPIPGERAQVEIDWQPALGGTKALLRVDGRAATVPGTLPGMTAEPAVHIGLMPINGAAPTIHLGWDSVRIASSTSDLGKNPLHAVHTFESGATSDWTATVGTGLDVNVASASSGVYGAEADASYPSYLLSDKPSTADAQLTAQVRVDLSQYFTTWGDISTIYAFGYAAAASTTDTRLRLRLYGGSSNEPRLLATFARSASGGGVAWSPSVAMPLVPSVVTVQYLAATSADNPNGYLRVWLDRDELFELDDLDSIGQEADWNHLGLYGTDPGTSGFILFDEFISAGR